MTVTQECKRKTRNNFLRVRFSHGMPEVLEILQNFEDQEVDDLDIDSKIDSYHFLHLFLLPYNYIIIVDIYITFNIGIRKFKYVKQLITARSYNYPTAMETYYQTR